RSPAAPRPAAAPARPRARAAGARPTIRELLAVPAARHDQAWLQQALQRAIELELSTIPPYLCALWSIADLAGPVYDQLLEVAVEEMFHMALACNMLRALGVKPEIATAAAVPKYPGPLPGGVRPGLEVGLQCLSKEQLLKVFMEIEMPDWKPL